MKYIFYTQNSFDVEKSMLLEESLNEYRGIRANVDGGFRTITFNYQKRKVSEEQINAMLDEHGIQRLKLNSRVLLEPYQIRLSITDVAIKDNVDLNTFISYAASMLKKTKLPACKPIRDLAKDNNIKLKRVSRFIVVSGRNLIGIIDKKQIIVGTGEHINGTSGIEEPRLYLIYDNQAIGYIEFCYK